MLEHEKTVAQVVSNTVVGTVISLAVIGVFAYKCSRSIRKRRRIESAEDQGFLLIES
tara:strand:- start:2062 stop:2232 length:171 start_codon:yes stop_codon:yes gene_type:complete